MVSIETVGGMTEDELLQSTIGNLLEQSGVRAKRPGEFTVADFMERAEVAISHSTATRKLRELEVQGMVEWSWGIVNGRQTRLYRMVSA